jgi:hypothetical protein
VSAARLSELERIAREAWAVWGCEYASHTTCTGCGRVRYCRGRRRARCYCLECFDAGLHERPLRRAAAQPRLELVPVTFRQACAYVERRHRHHGAPRGAKFCIGVVDELGELRGVVLVGRPIARAYDDGRTAEVLRSCTDGCPNACSALYGAAWRAARAMGYRRLVTYTQADESGASLRGAGWRVVAQRPPRASWRDSTRDEGLRALRDPLGAGGVQRTLWEVVGS